jgi:lipopolysaccharide transport system permease protein
MPNSLNVVRARDTGPGLIQACQELYRYRELLVAWVIRDIKVRYKQTLLGAAWAILQPLSLMLIFSFIFTNLVQIPTDGTPYPIFSYTSLLPWTFFSTSITFGVPSLANNASLLSKIYFPREVFPLAAIAASFIDFLVAAVVFLGMMIVYQINLRWTLLWVPLVLLVQIILTMGVVLFAAAVNVFYRDVRFIIVLAIQLWMYATPIIYPLSVVPDQFRAIYMLNPMAGIIESYRALILRGESPPWPYLGVAAVLSLIAFLLAYRWFKKMERNFADVI